MSKTKVLRYLKVMISKFCHAGHLILIFVRRILPPPRTISAFQGVSHFSNICSSTVYAKSALDLVGQFFLIMMLGTCLNGGDKKISAGNLPWMMPCNVFNYKFLQILFWMFICNNNSLLDLLGENREFLVYQKHKF